MRTCLGQQPTTGTLGSGGGFGGVGRGGSGGGFSGSALKVETWETAIPCELILNNWY